MHPSLPPGNIRKSSDVFRWYRKGALGTNELSTIIFQCTSEMHLCPLKPNSNKMSIGLHLHPCHSTGLLLYPLKTSENQRFSVFRGHRQRPMAWNRLRKTSMKILANLQPNEFTFNNKPKSWQLTQLWHLCC